MEFIKSYKQDGMRTQIRKMKGKKLFQTYLHFPALRSVHAVVVPVYKGHHALGHVDLNK